VKSPALRLASRHHHTASHLAVMRGALRLAAIPRRFYASNSLDNRAAIESFNGVLNAMVHVAEPSLDAQQHGGLVIAVKDNICTSSMPTTCSSAMLRHFDSPLDATCVRLLRESGAYIIGKTNCDEFGMGYVSDLFEEATRLTQQSTLRSLNIHSVHGPVVNPHNVNAREPSESERSAGGSSGGSAAAVAAGMCDA
jgi:aspartyl-tRNA(Asn)/glutamyl-tRNA(Gln) amidotransferase subunit A